MTCLGILVAALVSGAVNAAVIPVEPGHALVKLVDSCAMPVIHPSQSLLDTACAFGDLGNIESIGVAAGAPRLFVQISSGGFTSTDSCIFGINAGGIVQLINPSTGFGVCSRGTDLHYSSGTGLLVTQDQNFAPTERIATVNPTGGATGTWATVPAGLFFDNTFGMDFSRGIGGTDVPFGEILFTADQGGSGLHSAPLGGPTLAGHVVPPTAGDDVVIQPDGDWVHVPDFAGVITAYSPVGPAHVAFPSATGLNIQGIFSGAGLPFVFGSRATVCDSTGELYVSYSGAPGGNGIFRIDEPLLAASHLVTIIDEGLQDLMVGPAIHGVGSSLYFTIHDAGCEEVWELTLPECEGPPLVVELAAFTAELTKRGVLLRWETVNETDNAGFRVLRSIDDGGKSQAVELVSQELIPARGSALSGAAYELVDVSKRFTGRISYYLEDVDVHGRVTRHGPVHVDLGAPVSTRYRLRTTR